jgi:cellulose synthase/poly-beta-1,6-N-acetylglucosamine synthase-like glycosyltransferase
MQSIFTILNRRFFTAAILYGIGLVFATLIISYEICTWGYPQNNAGAEENSTLCCNISASESGYSIVSVVNIWCLASQTVFSRIIYRPFRVLVKGWNTYVITTIHFFLTWTSILIVTLSNPAYNIDRVRSDESSAIVQQPWFFAFLVLATFKFLKVFVHTFSFYLLTSPTQQPVNATIFPNDVTVIVPSVGEFDGEFIECIESIVANNPRRIIVSTAGYTKQAKAKKVCLEISSRHLNARITVLSMKDPNKRAQFLRGVSASHTQIIAYADDHVFWPPTFLKSALAPFEDQRVGLVGVAKKVRRDRSGGFRRSFLNYIACLYLERHNFECTASHNLDGGVFVISGRTALTRTNIVHHLHFRREFLNETWLWGAVGPMKVDDDNCITRWMVNNGWKTVFHNSSDAVIETTLGATGGLQKFRGQLLRWARTTWRSNSTSLFSDRTCWRVHPWTTYAMFISSFFNIALIYDPLLVLTLHRSGYTQYMYALLLAMLISKLIKPIEHLRREPQDIIMLPLGILFGYVHSLFKVWAFFTAGNIQWSGRTGIK